MSDIVFDMEWNMGYPRPEEPHFDEIIEIGAAKVENGEIVSTFKEYIRPSIHRVIHHHVRKLLPFTKNELKNAPDFRTVIRQFKDWCGPDARLISWGNSDISVLQSNLERYGMPTDWCGSTYDLQAGYAYLLGEYTRQYSLKDAVEQFSIDAPEEFHDAANDAYYTALVFAAFPESADLVATPLTPRELSHDANKGRSQRTMHTPAATVEASLLLDSIRTPSCPICAKKQALAADYLRQGENRYMALAVCPNHGLMNVRIRFLQDEDGKQRIEQCVQLAGKKDKAYIATKILQWQNKLAAQSEESPECS